MERWNDLLFLKYMAEIGLLLLSPEINIFSIQSGMQEFEAVFMIFYFTLLTSNHHFDRALLSAVPQTLK